MNINQFDKQIKWNTCLNGQSIIAVGEQRGTSSGNHIDTNRCEDSICIGPYFVFASLRWVPPSISHPNFKSPIRTRNGPIDGYKVDTVSVSIGEDWVEIEEGIRSNFCSGLRQLDEGKSTCLDVFRPSGLEGCT